MLDRPSDQPTAWAATRPASALLRRLAASCWLFVLALAAGCERCEPCEQVYRGIYVWGNEVNVFQPCDDKKSFWVSASTWVQEPLLEFYRSHTSQPYETIYVEFRGMVLDEVVGGFASDHDGLIRISEVLDLSLTVPEECH